MAEVLKVEPREKFGKRNSRRLRRAGSIPAILYGHGLPSLSLTCSADDFAATLRHGARLVSLSGAASEKAFVRELQWDTFGTEVLHIDFTRISDDERVEVEVILELRGEAPGTKAGGVLDHVLQRLAIECQAIAIPDKIQVNINDLQLGASLTVGDIELPASVTSTVPAETPIVHCNEPVEEAEDEDLVGDSAEPEVIGRKPGEEEEGKES